MSRHTFTRCLLHLVWATQERRALLNAEARNHVASALKEIADAHAIFLRQLFVNADHVHALIDLPPQMPMDEAAKLLKGASSHRINAERWTAETFAWQRGYSAFSVSPSRLAAALKYIAGQEEHHRKMTYAEEIAKLLEGYGLQERSGE